MLRTQPRGAFTFHDAHQTPSPQRSPRMHLDRRNSCKACVCPLTLHRKNSTEEKIMNWKKICTVALSLAGALTLASTSYAQAPQVVAVGSSGVFTTITIAMVSGDPITGATTCGTHVWTAGSGIASGIDARNGSIPAEGGNVAIVWDNDTTPTTVCAYLSVDSVVGQRLFLGQSASGNATLNLT